MWCQKLHGLNLKIGAKTLLPFLTKSHLVKGRGVGKAFTLLLGFFHATITMVKAVNNLTQNELRAAAFGLKSSRTV